MSANTLLVGSSPVDLRGLSYFQVNKMELRAPGTRRVTHDTIPGKPGAIPTPGPYDAYRFSVYGRVFGSTREEFNANLAALGVVVAGTDGVLPLTRHLAKTGGYDTHTANGAFITGLEPDMLNWINGRVQLQFWNLSGGWFDASAPTVLIVP